MIQSTITLLHFINLIKLYIDSIIQSIAIEIVPEILPETTSVQQSRLLGAIQKRESVFLRFLKGFCLFCVFFVFIQYFSFLNNQFFIIISCSYIQKKFYSDGQTQRRIQSPVDYLRWSFLMKIIKTLNYFRKNVPSRCDHVYTKRTFLFKHILKFSYSFNPFQSYLFISIACKKGILS